MGGEVNDGFGGIVEMERGKIIDAISRWRF
jgi:hypothetical protein